MSGDKDISVLYIEDEPLARWTGAKLIEPLVGRLAATASCAEAEALWSREDFDLVVSDYRLEDGQAVDLVERMRRSGRRTPVICLSGEAENIASAGNFAAVLKKPLDAELLRQTMREVLCAQAPESAGSTPDPVAVLEQSWPLPLWVAPEWELAVAAAPRLELAPGRQGGVWLLLFGNTTAPDGGRSAEPLVRLLFRQLAEWLPATATAEKMLSRCRNGLRRLIDREHLWSLTVIHLHAGRLTCARNFDDRNWLVWLQDAGRRWQPLTDWTSATEPQQALGCLVLAAASCEPAADGARLSALFDDAGAPAVLAGLQGLRLISCAPRRRVNLSAEMLAEPAAGTTLRRLERTLLDDGLEPVTVRRLACGLLDLTAGRPPDALLVEWAGRQATVTGQGENSPPFPVENMFFDEIDTGDGVWHARVLCDAADTGGLPQLLARGGRDRQDAVAGFDLLLLPELLTVPAAADLRRQSESRPRLALDAGRLSFVAAGALRVLREMADARRPVGGAPTGGALCLLGCAPLMETVLRRAGLERDVDMVADCASLESLARRLTSMSERASILESVVKW